MFMNDYVSHQLWKVREAEWEKQARFTGTWFMNLKRKLIA